MDQSVCFFAGKTDLAFLYDCMQKQELVCFFLYKELLPLGEVKFIPQRIDLSNDFPARRFSILIIKKSWTTDRRSNGWIWRSGSEIMELTLRRMQNFDVYDCRLYAIMDYLVRGEIVPKSEDFRTTCTALMEFIRSNTAPLRRLRLMPQAHRVFLQNPGKIQLCQSYFERES